MKTFSSIRSSMAALVASITALTFKDRQRQRVIFGAPQLVDKSPILIEAPALPRRGQRLYLAQKRREHAAELLRRAKFGEVPRKNRDARRADAQRLIFA